MALGWYESGMDFADALHLALADTDQGLATLDRGIKRHAARLQLEDRVLLLEPSSGPAS